MKWTKWDTISVIVQLVVCSVASVVFTLWLKT